MAGMTHCRVVILVIDMSSNKVATVIFILNIVMIGGCIVKSYQYQYIQVSNAVEMAGKAHQTSELKRLKNHKAMPIFYRITRNSYTIYFELDRLSFYPSVFITVKKAGSDDLLRLKGGKKLGCGRFDEFKYENGKQISYESERKLRYEWFPDFACPRKGKISDQIITFQILNDQGELFGEEKIPFTLKANGLYYETDSI